jgi:hypothetical protein
MAQRKSVNLIRDRFPEADKEVLRWVDLEHISIKEMMQLKIMHMFKEVVARELAEKEKKSASARDASSFERRLSMLLDKKLTEK